MTLCTLYVIGDAHDVTAKQTHLVKSVHLSRDISTTNRPRFIQKLSRDKTVYRVEMCINDITKKSQTRQSENVKPPPRRIG